jgi:hypothetical protein
VLSGLICWTVAGRREARLKDALPKFAMPDLLSGRQPDGNFHMTIIRWQRASLAWDEFIKAHGAKEGAVDFTVKPQQFSRVLAKIAHAYAVARLGVDGFEPFLIDLIHQRNVVRAPEFVGSEPETPPPASGVVHELGLVENQNFVVVRIRLFASSSIQGAHGFPVYLVVAGKPTKRSWWTYWLKSMATLIRSFSPMRDFTQRRKKSLLRSLSRSHSVSSVGSKCSIFQ